MSLSKIPDQIQQGDKPFEEGEDFDETTKNRLSQLNGIVSNRSQGMGDINLSGIQHSGDAGNKNAYLKDFEKRYLDHLDREGSPSSRKAQRAQTTTSPTRLGGASPKRVHPDVARTMTMVGGPKK